MYSQHYPLMNNVVYSQQQQPYQQQQRLPSPLHPTVIQQTRKEPLPSATDAKPNITLSIPEIAEFSSTMVYLMWHARRQSVMDLHSNSKSTNIQQQQQNNSLEQTRVTVDLANMTSTAFKKFCRQILSATQLSESVVFLSLKYIAMLLQNNPNIQGADGSEYRLFTVALMLANKFLDDNTFTNKTWSEVSGMKVIDLNIMELEFLDVLKFRLSIQKEEYERWRTALFGFRSQLINVPIEIQRQKLMETMELSVNSQWMQKQQQQQQVAAASKHDFFLFSKAQQQYPVQPTFHGPLTRVPLRIPSQPVYHNLHTTPSAPMNVYNEQKTYAFPPSTKQQSRNNYTQQQSPFHTPSSSNTTRAFPYSNVDHYPKRTNHRTTSLPSNGGLDLAASKNNNNSYYYATPSTTPTYTTPVNYPTTTSYYVDPSSNTTPNTATTANIASATATTYNSSSSPTDYNPYHNSSIAPVNDVYNRPMVPRSTSYKNVQPPVVTPASYQPQQSYHHQPHQPQQPQHHHQGPTLEDPLTAIESYRTTRH